MAWPGMAKSASVYFSIWVESHPFHDSELRPRPKPWLA
jgi:hypothetical protein